MTDENDDGSTSMPLELRVVRGLLWFQAAANLLVAIVVVVGVFEDVGHGRDDVEDIAPGLVAGLVALLLAAVLTVCALGTSWRVRWVRTTTIVIQAMNLVAGVPALFTADPVYVLVGMGLAAVILAVLNRRDVERWFDR